MFVVVIAIAGAFASNRSNQSEKALVDRLGYIKSGEICTPTTVMCSTDFHENLCSDGVNFLFDWNGTSCEEALYRRVITP